MKSFPKLYFRELFRQKQKKVPGGHLSSVLALLWNVLLNFRLGFKEANKVKVKIWTYWCKRLSLIPFIA